MSNFEVLTINSSAELVASNINMVGCDSLVSMSDAVYCTTALNETNDMQTDVNSVSSMVNFPSQEQFVGESIAQNPIQDILMTSAAQSGILATHVCSDDNNLIDTYALKLLPKYICVGTLKGVEDEIRRHSEETFSHFVVAKKTKGFGKTVASTVAMNQKFRIHWQSRDLTSTEECAVQIPYDGVPFIYIGEKAYMCHRGRSKNYNIKLRQQEEKEQKKTEEKPRKTRTKISKKDGCPAKVFIKQIAKFPQFKLNQNTEYNRTQMSQKVRKALLESKGELNHIIRYIGTLPNLMEHKDHNLRVNPYYKEPIDPLVRDKMLELAWSNKDMLPKQIKEVLVTFVEDTIFKGRLPPLKSRRRFYPTEKDISNSIYKSKMISKLTKEEQENLHKSIEKLKLDRRDDKIYSNFHLSLDLTSDTLSNNSENMEKNSNANAAAIDKDLIFCYQTDDQRNFLKKYGDHAVLAQLSNPSLRLPFPCFGIFVPTNVDFQLVYFFIIQTVSKECLLEAIQPIFDWNMDWKPKYITVDFSKTQIEATETLFPSCPVLISDISREFFWKEWLDNPLNFSGDKDEVFNSLSQLAASYDEGKLKIAAENLENTSTWKSNENFRNWFSNDWLKEAKRWVAGYKHEEYINTLHIGYDLRDDLKSISESHFDLIKNKKLLELILLIAENIIPSMHKRYVKSNLADVQKKAALLKSLENPPLYLENRPYAVAKHIFERMENAKSKNFIVNQVESGFFHLTEKENLDRVFIVTFGNSVSFPSCLCDDWLKYKLPCQHIVSVFETFLNWSWGALSVRYTSNPILNIDTACSVDIRGSDNTKSTNSNLEQSFSTSCIGSADGGNNTTHSSENELSFNSGENSAAEHDLTNNAAQPTLTTKSTTDSKVNESVIDSESSISDLVNDCNEICQAISEKVQEIRQQRLLEKIKVDLTFLLNDINLEISKLPQTDNRPCKRKLQPVQVSGLKNEELGNAIQNNLTDNNQVIPITCDSALYLPQFSKKFKENDFHNQEQPTLLDLVVIQDQSWSNDPSGKKHAQS